MQLPKVFLLLSAALMTNAEPPVVRDSAFSGYEPAISRQPPSELYEVSSRSNSVPSSSYLPQSYNSPSQQYGTPFQRNSFPSSQYNVPAFQNNPSLKYNTPNQISNSPSEIYGTPSQRSGQQLSSHHNQGRHQSSSSYTDSNFRNSAPAQEYGAPLQRNDLPQQYGVPNQRTTSLSQYRVPTSRNTPSQEYGTPSQRYSPSEYQTSSFQRNSLSQIRSAPSVEQQEHSFANPGHTSQKHGLSQSYSSQLSQSVPNQRSTPSQGYGAPGISVPYQQFGSTSARHGAPAQDYGVPSNQYLPAARSGEAYDDGTSNEPANYEFSYAVKEDESGNDFEHRESRNDEKTFGSYSVTLPDGIKQTVEYEADENGFRPRITKEDTGNVYQGRSGFESGTGGYDENSQNYSGNQDTEVVIARTQSKANGGY